MTPEEVKSHVITYRTGGLRVFPLPWAKKRPETPAEKKAIKGWKAFKLPSIEEVNAKWAALQNVAVILGDVLCDVDIDQGDAVPFADILFEDCPAFGHGPCKRTHRVFECRDAGRHVDFPLLSEEEGKSYLELRGKEHYTVFPPSLHPSGEQIEWDPACGQNFPVIPWDEAHARCAAVAMLAAVLPLYPTTQGHRDELCMALASPLLELGLGVEVVNRLLVKLAELANDEEARTRSKAAATKASMDSGENVTGLTRVAEILGLSDTDVVKRIRKWFPGQAPVSVPAGSILVAEGRLNEILDEAEAAMRPGALYEYGTELVRIIRQAEPSPEQDPVRRAKGALLLTAVEPLWLVQEWARSEVKWFRVVAKKPQEIDPPDRYARHYIARKGHRKVPALKGFINAPTLRLDGSVLDRPGYDEATGLILDPGGVEFPPVPEHPTKEQASDAMLRLARPFRKMPFVSKADESVALAMVLTGLIRRILPTAPMFLLDAPAPGSGKTIIAEVAGVVATGYVPAGMSVGGSAEELEKRLVSVLLAGDPVILLDNLSAPLPASDLLCSMLTGQTVKPRVLGRNENPTLPCAVLVMATGNNIAVKGDAYRRAVKCRINAGVEQPEKRQFDFHPVKEAMAQRADLVVAGLTALRWAMRQTGRASVPRLGSYEDWNLVQNTLVWLGWEDPVATQEEIRCLDSDTSSLGELLHEWHKVYGCPHKVTVKQLWDVAQTHDELRGIMLECVAHRGDWNARSFGRYLDRHKDMIIGGLQLRRGPDSHKQATWEVVNLAGQKELVWAA